MEPSPRKQTQNHDLDPLSDADIVRLIAKGEPEAMSAAYSQHAARVSAVALNIVRDRDLAADVAQDVFERLWHRPDRFDPDRGSLGVFLAVDAHGRSIDLIRSRAASKRRELDDHLRRSADVVPDTEHEALRRIEASSIRASLMSLPEEQRVPITLAYFDGISYRQVAERLRMPEGTVKSRIRAGLQSLGSSLADVASVA
jgi:RNA polymerase sigma-70 factor (ECF subfamily)